MHHISKSISSSSEGDEGPILPSRSGSIQDTHAASHYFTTKGSDALVVRTPSVTSHRSTYTHSHGLSSDLNASKLFPCVHGNPMQLSGSSAVNMSLASISDGAPSLDQRPSGKASARTSLSTKAKKHGSVAPLNFSATLAAGSASNSTLASETSTVSQQHVPNVRLYPAGRSFLDLDSPKQKVGLMGRLKNMLSKGNLRSAKDAQRGAADSQGRDSRARHASLAPPPRPYMVAPTHVHHRQHPALGSSIHKPLPQPSLRLHTGSVPNEQHHDPGSPATITGVSPASSSSFSLINGESYRHITPSEFGHYVPNTPFVLPGNPDFNVVSGDSRPLMSSPQPPGHKRQSKAPAQSRTSRQVTSSVAAKSAAMSNFNRQPPGCENSSEQLAQGGPRSHASRSTTDHHHHHHNRTSNNRDNSQHPNSKRSNIKSGLKVLRSSVSTPMLRRPLSQLFNGGNARVEAPPVPEDPSHIECQAAPGRPKKAADLPQPAPAKAKSLFRRTHSSINDSSRMQPPVNWDNLPPVPTAAPSNHRPSMSTAANNGSSGGKSRRSRRDTGNAARPATGHRYAHHACRLDAGGSGSSAAQIKSYHKRSTSSVSTMSQYQLSNESRSFLFFALDEPSPTSPVTTITARGDANNNVVDDDDDDDDDERLNQSAYFSCSMNSTSSNMHSSLADSEFSASRLNVLFNIADAHLSTLRGPPPRPSLALDVQAPDKDDSELLSEIYDNPWVGSVSHSLASIKSCSGGDGSDNYDTGSEQQGQQSSTSSRREEANEEQEREGGAEPGTEEQRKKERATTSPLPVQSSPNSEYTILRGKNGTLIPIRGPLSPFTLAIWEKAMISPKDSDTAAVEHPSRSSSDHTIKSPMSGATAIFESPPSRDPNQRLPGSLSPCMSSTPDVFGGNTLISSRSRGDADGAAKPKSSCTYQQLSASGTSRRIRPRKSVKDLDLVFSMDDFLTKLPSIPQSPLRL